MDTIKEKIIDGLWNGLGSAWSEFTSDERAQFEKGWGVVYDVFDVLINEIIQRSGNFSLLTAPPFFISSGLVFSFIATTEESLELLDLQEAPDVQYLSRYLIYLDKFIPLNEDSDISYDSVEFSNVNEEDISTAASVDEIYYLTSSGFIELDGTNPIWVEDPLLGTIDEDDREFDPYIS